MYVPDVKRVFTALGNDEDGGMWASDEQVMLVAAPIAVANNIDVDRLAEELWKRSAGWRAAPASMLVPEPGPRTGPFTEVCISHCAWYDPMPSSIEVVPTGPPGCAVEPANAMQAQFAVLARDAFQIVEEVKIGKLAGLQNPVFVLGTRPSPAEAASKSRMALLLGAAGSVGLLIAGTPLAVAALPVVAAALLSRGASKQRASSAERA
jgi:hypothetical protein